MTRIPIIKYGERGAIVNVYEEIVDGEPVAFVEWREKGRRPSRMFRGTKRDREREAKAFAKGTSERLVRKDDAAPRRRTVGELWDAYFTAHSSSWRIATRTINSQRWRVFLQHVSPHTYADLVQMETLDTWRESLLSSPTKRGVPMARNQVAHHVQVVKSVWKFARTRKLIPENVLADYAVKLGRDYQPMEIDEFTPAEFVRIMAQLTYRTSHGWRVWAAIALDGLLAPRSKAMLSLEWNKDIDLDARTVTWRKELDKVGKQRVQRLPRDAVFVLRICRVWCAREGRAGGFVFPGRQERTEGKHWGYSALNSALHKACDRAKVPRKAFRAMHGIRRMVAGNILALTGDITKVGIWLGDTDMKVMKKSYLRGRPEDVEPVVLAMTLPKRDTSGSEVAVSLKTPTTQKR